MVYQGNHGFIALLFKENSEALTKGASLSILINFARYIYFRIAKSSVAPKSVKNKTKTKINVSTL